MPKYKNAPIEEAMCQFSFGTSPPSQPWDLTLPGRMQQHDSIRNIYSAPSRQQIIQEIIADQTPNAQPSIALASGLLRVQLPSPDNKSILGIGANTLLISVLREYEGWQLFKPRIQSALNAYFDVAKPPSITRVGIRYINRIVTPKPLAAEVDTYLTNIIPRLCAHIPGLPPITAALRAFHARNEFVTPDNIKVLVTLATLQPMDPATSEYLLDIDTTFDQAPSRNVDDAMSLSERLHTLEGAIFEGLITDAARSLFDAD